MEPDRAGGSIWGRADHHLAAIARVTAERLAVTADVSVNTVRHAAKGGRASSRHRAQHHPRGAAPRRPHGARGVAFERATPRGTSPKARGANVESMNTAPDIDGGTPHRGRMQEPSRIATDTPRPRRPETPANTEGGARAPRASNTPLTAAGLRVSPDRARALLARSRVSPPRDVEVSWFNGDRDPAPDRPRPVSSGNMAVMMPAARGKAQGSDRCFCAGTGVAGRQSRRFEMTNAPRCDPGGAVFRLQRERLRF